MCQQYSPTPLGISVFADSWHGGPAAWAACVQRLVWVRRHEGAGTYAAWERPEVVVSDLRTFLGEEMVGQLGVSRLREVERDLEELD